MTAFPDLPVVVIAPTMRSGSDLLHSLLDSHPQVLQMPGHWNLYDFWTRLSNVADSTAVVHEFIRSYPEKFDGSVNEREQWDKLGESGDSSFHVDSQAFQEAAVELLDDVPELTPAKLAIALTTAYALSRGTRVDQARVLLVHAHYFTELSRYEQDFSEATILCTVRDPRNGVLSWLKTLDRHDSLDEETVASQLHRVLVNYLLTVPGLDECSNVIFVKLEDLHTKGETIMHDLSHAVGIDFDPLMMVSTVNGLSWHGDLSSAASIRGLRSDAPALKQQFRTEMSRQDRMLIEGLLSEPMKCLGYQVSRGSRISGYLLGPFLSLRKLDLERRLHDIGRQRFGCDGRALRNYRVKRRRACLIRYGSLFKRRPTVGVILGSGQEVRW